MPSVFVLSLFDTGLVTARLFVKSGIEVYGFDSNPAMPGFRTRLFPAILTPSLENEAAFVGFLCDKAKKFNTKPLLVPASDAYTAVVLRNYEVFSEHFLFALSERELALTLLNKQSQYELVKKAGFRQAQSVSVFKTGEGKEEALGMKFPLLVKPLHPLPWKALYSEKAIEIANENDAVILFDKLALQGIDTIVQEIIPGDVTNNIETGVYITRNGNVSPVFCYRKLRQYPADYGVATFAQSEVLPEIEQMVKSLAEKLGIQGFANIEFKYHPGDKEYYLIEINTRVWQQIDFAAACGIDYADIFYRDLTGQTIFFPKAYNYPARWISPYSDLLSFIEAVKEGKENITSFLSSYKNAVSFSLFDKEDIKPALYDIDYGLKFIKAPFKIVKRLFS